MQYGYPQYPGYPAHGHQFQPGYGASYQGAPTYGAPGYGWHGMPPVPSNGMGVASLILGIIAAAGFCVWPLAIVLGVLAVIFGVIGRAKARRGQATNPGQALAGIICGAAGIVLAVLAVAFIVAVSDDGGVSDDGYSAAPATTSQATTSQATTQLVAGRTD